LRREADFLDKVHKTLIYILSKFCKPLIHFLAKAHNLTANLKVKPNDKKETKVPASAGIIDG